MLRAAVDSQSLFHDRQYIPMTSRYRRAWKDAWLSFRSMIWTSLDEPGWCWFSQALQLYRREENHVLDSLRTEFDDLSWWEQWRQWNQQYERLLPRSDDLRNASLSSPLPSELPLPPDEPTDLWARTGELWTAENRWLAIGGGTIRTVLARGRATRRLRGE